MTKDVELKIEYHTEYRPRVFVSVHKVCDGVWYVNIDFFERFYCDVTGSGDGWEMMLFDKGEDAEEILFTVYMKFPNSGILFNSGGKKAAYATFYEDDAYSKILGECISEVEKGR